MIEVQKMILEVMKKQRFAASDSESAAARSVLAELKTKQIDLRTKGEIDALVQQKVLLKMKSDRDNSAKAFADAGRAELAEAEKLQAHVIDGLLEYLAPELPKQLGGAEVRALIEKVLADNPGANMGVVMKAFRDRQDVDRKMVSTLAAAMLKK